MTLVELLLALAITALIGAAVAGMLHAAAMGTNDSADGRRIVVQFKRLDARVGAALRSARLALESGASYVILWERDADASGLPNLSEIRLIERRPTGELVCREWNGSGADTAYALTAFGTTGRATLDGTGRFNSVTVWDQGVRSLAVSFGGGVTNIQSAHLIAYRIGIGAGATQATIVGAAAMRNP